MTEISRDRLRRVYCRREREPRVESKANGFSRCRDTPDVDSRETARTPTRRDSSWPIATCVYIPYFDFSVPPSPSPPCIRG
jgi:hypothetical protein